MQRFVLLSTAMGVLSATVLGGAHTFAATKPSNWHETFKRATITNPRRLYYDATHNIRSKQAPPFKVVGAWSRAGGRDVARPQTAYTTQRVASYTTSNGATKSDYVTTAFVTGNTTYDGTGSQSGTSWDSSGGVEAYATIYWNKYTANGILETKLTKVTGGWHVYDGTEYVRNERVNYGASGWTMQGGYVQQASDGNNPEPSLTFSYTPPSSWVPISMKSTTLPRVFGTYTTATVVQGSSSWGMSLKVEDN